MRKTLSLKLLFICLGALVFRLVLLRFVAFPGIADPNHYYNMALRLVEGHGFTIDYIWQYNLPPESIIHPEEHWMPLTAILAAVPMALFGESVHAALLPFVILSALLPALSYWAARQLDLSEGAALFSAAVMAVLPQIMIYSLRTDTVIPASFFICLSILLLTGGLRRGGALPFIGSGIAVGLAYLTRNDGALLIPMFVVTLIVYALRRKYAPGFHWRAAILMPLVALIVAAPWIARNLQEFGTPGSPEADDMFFMTSHNDHYLYAPHLTLQTMLASQPVSEVISKRLFELAAAGKTIIQSFDVFLPVAVVLGLLLMLSEHDRRRLLTLSPVLILVLGLLVAYPLLLPYKSQAGSFMKSYFASLPLLVPIGAYAVDRAIPNPQIRITTMLLVLVLAGVNAVQAVQQEAIANSDYLAIWGKMTAQAHTLPDTNDDGEIILMTTDPYVVRYLGTRSIMFPSEDRDKIIEIVHEYGVDYLVMPSNRPSLDPLLWDAVTDPRYIQVEPVVGTNFIFYAIETE